MRRLGASAMIISEDVFEDGLVRALEAALAAEPAKWEELHSRHRQIFDADRNFRKLRRLLER